MEERRVSSLQQALQNLPTFQAPDALWQAIHHELDHPSADQPLHQALHTLPDVIPPADLWDAISAELTFREKEAALHRTIRRLPQYEPPPIVWKEIQTTLTQSRLQRTLHALKPYRWAAAAALIGVTAGLAYLGNTSQTAVTFLASTEQAPAGYSIEINDQDQDAIREIGAAFTAYHNQYNDPQGEELIQELNELESASKELRQVLRDYGFDDKLAQELTRVELQRDQVIRKMATAL